MISKDQSIIMQVAAKIAAELTRNMDSMEATLTDWEMAFNFVNDKLQTANGVAIVQNAFPTATMVEETTSTPNYTLSAARVVDNVVVAGTQHGDLPSWLVSACKKAGVGRVWDNRDTAVGTKRPWFKQADAPEGVEPAAFWPPKNSK